MAIAAKKIGAAFYDMIPAAAAKDKAQMNSILDSIIG